MNRTSVTSGSIIAIALLLMTVFVGCGGTSTTATTATTATAAATAAAPDWADYGYMLAGGKDLTPGQADTVTAGELTFQIPSNAFSVPVRFEVLTLPDPSTLKSKLPDSTPIIAFALRVKDKSSGQLIATFDNPVMVIAQDPGITAESAYYNITVQGDVSLNPTGTQAKAGELDHPEAGTVVAWVIATPVAGGTPGGGASTDGTTTGGTSTGGTGGGGTPYQSPY